MELRKGDAAEDIDGDFESWEKDLLAALKAYFNACWNKQELFLRFLRLHLHMTITEHEHLLLRERRQHDHAAAHQEQAAHDRKIL